MSQQLGSVERKQEEDETTNLLVGGSDDKGRAIRFHDDDDDDEGAANDSIDDDDLLLMQIVEMRTSGRTEKEQKDIEKQASCCNRIAVSTEESEHHKGQAQAATTDAEEEEDLDLDILQLIRDRSLRERDANGETTKREGKESQTLEDDVMTTKKKLLGGKIDKHYVDEEEGEGSEEIPVITPTGMVRNPSQQQEPQQPGAYSRAPGEAPQRLSTDFRLSMAEAAGATPQEEESHPAPEQALGRDDLGDEGLSSSNGTLSEAFAIDDDLMEAQQVPQEEIDERQETTVNKGLVYVIIALIVCASLAIGLGVPLKRTKDQNKLLEANRPDTQAPSAMMITALSEAPSSAPTGPLDLLLQALPSYTLQSLNAGLTPQWKALEWIKDHPDLLNMEEWKKIQLFALATVFYALEGSQWPKPIQENWLQYEKDECYWFSNEYGNFGEFGKYVEGFAYNMTPCSEDQRFQFLLLADLKLSDHKPVIPPEISLLTSLSILALPFCDINAKLSDFLPEQIYHMSSLSELNFVGYYAWVNDNALTGTIPVELANLNLTRLLLWGNWLHGTIPTALGLMTAMTDLQLSWNDLSGTIPTQLGLMTNMAELILETNRLSGPIPTELGVTQIRRMDLSNMTLTGTIPIQLGALKNLTHFFFDTNMLSGIIPSQLGLIRDMTHLMLHDNRLTGSTPTELGMLTSLLFCVLHANQLTGTLVSELALASNLVYLSLKSNQFSGVILPSELAMMPHLNQIWLDDNHFTGSVPQEFGSLLIEKNGSLSLLQVATNDLTGTIQEEMCSLGMFNESIRVGLSFDCNDQLCGCEWCTCRASPSNQTVPSSPSNQTVPDE